jgi:phenylacetate-CoA ligase
MNAAVTAKPVFLLHSLWERNRVPCELRRLERSQWLSAAAIEDHQNQRLQALLLHTSRRNAHYRQFWQEQGVDVSQIKTVSDLVKMPVLTKEHIQSHWRDMVSEGFRERDIILDRTGGSSGKPLRFAMDRRRYFTRIASAYRHDRWAGWDFGFRVACIWGHPRAFLHKPNWRERLRNRWLDRRIMLDSSSLSPETMLGFLKTLQDYRPQVLIGYANSVYLFARFLMTRGEVGLPPLAGIITSAEVLSQERRQIIEECFGCRVFDRYGSRETGIIGSECEAHDGLHLCSEHLVVEIERNGVAASPGEHGRILITDLSNYGMPLIRYRIEDMGVPMSGGCSCGRGLWRMGMAAGRETDFLVTPEGQLVSGAALTIYLIAKAPGVLQAQIVQDRPGTVRLRVVAGEGYGPETEAFFARQIPNLLGATMTWQVELVAAIDRLPSGKHAFCISNIDPSTVF